MPKRRKEITTNDIIIYGKQTFFFKETPDVCGCHKDRHHLENMKDPCPLNFSISHCKYKCRNSVTVFGSPQFGFASAADFLLFEGQEFLRHTGLLHLAKKCHKHFHRDFLYLNALTFLIV